MAVVVQHMKNHNLVLAQGFIDSEDCHILEQVLNNTSLSRCKTVWVDCEQISSFSVDALQKILSLSRKADQSGVTLLFYQLNPSLRGNFKKVGLNKELNILPTIADAYRFHEKLVKQLN